MDIANHKHIVGWRDSKAWGFFLIGLYVLAAIFPIIITLVYSKPLDAPAIIKLSLIIAMIGFSLLCLQVVLAGRFKTLDRPFGLDMVMRFHKSMAVLALVLLLMHPLLIAAGHRNWALLGMETSWKVNLGKLSLLFLVVGVLLAIFFSKLRIDYNLWRILHKGMVFVLCFGFAHGLVIGRHIKGSEMVRNYWFVIFIIAAAIFIFRNVVVPFIAREFVVTDIQKETHNTYTLTFEPKDRKPLYRNPGQFMFLKLIRPGISSELHPFTISASPLKTDILQATIKQSGNFTNTIDRTKIGDTGKIEAPYGRFSYVYDNPSKIIFIAGGVGITPIMSMIRCLRDTRSDMDVTLFYCNESERDIIFRQEIEQLPDNFKTIHILNNPDDHWYNEKGYITADIVSKYAGEILNEADIYLCGPIPMISAVMDILDQMKVDKKKIHSEQFTI